MKNKFKSGDEVYYKDDKQKTHFRVYAIYSETKVSLGLKDYPDIEQDYQTDVDKLEMI